MRNKFPILLSALAFTALALVPTSPAQTRATLVTLYTFTAGGSNDNMDGRGPSGLTIGRDGNLYGTTHAGGEDQAGTIFEITANGHLSVLDTFNTLTDGRGGNSLILGPDGNFYTAPVPDGTTTIIEVTPGGKVTILDNLGESSAPFLWTLGSDGYFYGTEGTSVFKMTTGGTLTTVAQIPDSDVTEVNGLIQARDGNLYGTTFRGGMTSDGSSGYGTVFKVTPAGTFTELHQFSIPNDSIQNGDGAYPAAGLIQGSDGNFYGTTEEGGVNGTGTIFKITSAGVLTTLYTFSAVTNTQGYDENVDGAYPVAALLEGSDGNFYGSATDAGLDGSGTIFQLTPAGAFTTLYDFSTTDRNASNKDGASPAASLVQGGDGNFYGSAGGGGVTGGGTIFRLTLVPAITSPDSATAYVGKAFSYQIKTSFKPTSYGVQGLPAGLTVNTTTGLISGTPKAAGKLTLTLNAYAGSGGKVSQPLALTVLGVPVVTSATSATATVGAAFSYKITASNSPTSFGVQGLPAGFTVNTTTGVLSGTPKAAGTVKLTLNAINAAGKGSATLTLTIKQALPVVTSAKTASGKVGTAFSYQITATNSPTSFGVQGLPAGLGVDTKSGLITGTPKAAGTLDLTLNVYNGAGKGSAPLTVTISAP